MKIGGRAAAFFRNLIVFAILWVVLTEGDTFQIWVGSGFVALAALSATWISSRSEVSWTLLRLRAVAAYLTYFIYHSLTGGVDVARRAFRIGRNVRPIYVSYRLRIPPASENARIVFAISICLFPGSLSCVFRENTLIIQGLDEELADMASIRRLEELVARLFSIPSFSSEWSDGWTQE